MLNFTVLKKSLPQLRKTVVLVLLLAGFAGFAQPSTKNGLAKTAKDTVITSIKITGTVVDGEPLPNIVVIEKGTDNLAITDKDGNFSLDIPIDHFVKKKVWLRFEVLTRKPLERKVAANTKHLKIDYSQKPKRQRWHVDEEEQSELVSDLIAGAIDTLIHIAKNIKREEDDDDKPEPREVKSKTPRF